MSGPEGGGGPQPADKRERWAHARNQARAPRSTAAGRRQPARRLPVQAACWRPSDQTSRPVACIHPCACIGEVLVRAREPDGRSRRFATQGAARVRDLRPEARRRSLV